MPPGQPPYEPRTDHTDDDEMEGSSSRDEIIPYGGGAGGWVKHAHSVASCAAAYNMRTTPPSPLAMLRYVLTKAVPDSPYALWALGPAADPEGGQFGAIKAEHVVLTGHDGRLDEYTGKRTAAVPDLLEFYMAQAKKVWDKADLLAPNLYDSFRQQPGELPHNMAIRLRGIVQRLVDKPVTGQVIRTYLAALNDERLRE